jgi:DNA-directed RNA polymerase subunit RPC12/RpoP
MMKIVIIGQGFVGKATALTLNQDVEWHDPPKGLTSDYKSADAITKYIGYDFHANAKPKDEVDAILKLQSQIKSNRLLAKHTVITDKIDKAMELITSLPDDFDKWIHETALLFSRYIYYDRKHKSGHAEGFCTYCKQDVTVKNPAHNAIGLCPNCRSSIMYKVISRTSDHVDSTNVGYIQ